MLNGTPVSFVGVEEGGGGAGSCCCVDGRTLLQTLRDVDTHWEVSESVNWLAHHLKARRVFHINPKHRQGVRSGVDGIE